jgi:hypothetical protein
MNFYVVVLSPRKEVKFKTIKNMNKPKVYLAKSNRANPNYVSKVRQMMEEYDIEIVEFTGGTYNSKDLVECNQLVVIPEINKSGKVQPLGKGLYTQIFEFSKAKAEQWKTPFDFDYVLFLADEDFNAYGITLIEIKDTENYVDYASVTTYDEGDNMFMIFEDELNYVLKPKDLIVIHEKKEVDKDDIHNIIKL